MENDLRKKNFNYTPTCICKNSQKIAQKAQPVRPEITNPL